MKPRCWICRADLRLARALRAWAARLESTVEEHASRDPALFRKQPPGGFTFMLDDGGRITIQEEDGRFDIAVIAAEGPSAAAYATRHEVIGLAGALRGQATR